MKTNDLFGMLFLIACFTSCNQMHKSHDENGWYHVIPGQKDCIAKEPIVTVKDLVSLRLDSGENGVYTIVGRISKHKLNKWADEIEKAIGKQIAFIFNDTVITNSRINARIENGTFQISSSYGYDLKTIYDKMRKEKIDSIESIFKDWDKESIYHTFSQEQKDSVRVETDYWDALSISQGFK